jgi:predicted nucleic acid-binding Zn ribbon protein
VAPSDDDLARAMLAQARTGDRSKVRRPRSSESRRDRSGGGYSGPAPDGRDPQLIGSSVDDLVSDRGWSQPLAIGGVEGRWSQIVGDDVAAHCWPEEFEAGRLVVRADSTAWATQVRLLSMTLLARLNDDLGAGTVTHLHVLGPKGPSWKKGRLRVKGRGPRDTYG